MKLERWKEHFEETLNRPEPTNPIEINDDECSETIDEITITSITQDEIKKALKMMKNGKASGKDSITAELLKADVEITSVVLEDLFQDIWENEIIPKNWTQGIITKIPKKVTSKYVTTTEE